jgi:hypothetical protein
MTRRSRRSAKNADFDPAERNFRLAIALLRDHPLFAPLIMRAWIGREAHSPCPPDGWAVVVSNGNIYGHPTRRGEPEEWVYVLAHCLLHLGFEHFQPHENPRAWNAGLRLCGHTFPEQPQARPRS